MNLHIRSALGEVQGLIFLPIAFAGIYDLIYKNFKKSWLLVLGFTGLCYTHVITTYIVAVISFLLCLFNLKKVLKHWKKLLLSVFITIGLAAPFLFPCIELYIFQDIKAHYPHESTANNALFLKQLFNMNDWLGGVQLVIELFVLLALSFLPKQQEGKLYQIYKVSLLMGVFTLFCVTKFFIWNNNPLLNSIQFPWRLLGTASFFISLSLSSLILLIDRRVHSARLLISLFILLFSLSTLLVWNQIEKAPPRQKHTIELLDPLFGTWLEFTPYKLSKEYILKTGNRCLDAVGHEAICTFKKNKKELLLSINKQSSFIDLPLTYYIGYEAKDVNSSKLLKIVESPNGVCRVLLSNSTKISTVRVQYVGTWTQKASWCVLLVTLAVLVYYQIVAFRKSRIQKVKFLN